MNLTWRRTPAISKDGENMLIFIGDKLPTLYSGIALLIASISFGLKLGWLLKRTQM